MFVRWWRLPKERKKRMWRMYGWFTGLMCCGSCIGAVAWALSMRALTNLYNIFSVPRSPTRIIVNEKMAAESFRLIAAYLVLVAVEFLCLSLAKLMVQFRTTAPLALKSVTLVPQVLFRTVDLSVPEGEQLPKRWSTTLRILMLAVICGNLVGVCSNIVAAVYYTEASKHASSAAVAFADGNVFLGLSILNRELEREDAASKVASIQQFCEVAVLLVIVFAFVAAGFAFSRYASARLRELDLAARGDAAAILRVDPFTAERSEAESMAAAATTVVSGGRTLRQVIVTASAVFTTFLLRAAFATMFALANLNQNIGGSKACEIVSNCDDTCFNVWEQMQMWLLYTPEFQLTIVLISSPLALLVALWGMTTENMSKTLHGSRQLRTMQGSFQKPLLL